jgi:hypothetical protein
MKFLLCTNRRVRIRVCSQVRSHCENVCSTLTIHLRRILSRSPIFSTHRDSIFHSRLRVLFSRGRWAFSVRSVGIAFHPRAPLSERGIVAASLQTYSKMLAQVDSPNFSFFVVCLLPTKYPTGTANNTTHPLHLTSTFPCILQLIGSITHSCTAVFRHVSVQLRPRTSR